MYVYHVLSFRYYVYNIYENVMTWGNFLISIPKKNKKLVRLEY